MLVAFILFRSFLLNKELTAPRLSLKLNRFSIQANYQRYDLFVKQLNMKSSKLVVFDNKTR